MPKRLGLIQTRGIGDVLIALPIADHHLEQGFEVLWPIDRRFLAVFQRARSDIQFLPVSEGPGYFLDDPLRMLREAGCERVVSLYSYLSTHKVYDERLAAALKFDEYKYAVANVPFARKWTLRYDRDLAREQALFDRLGIRGPYLCVHDEGSDVQLGLDLPPEMTAGHQVIHVKPLTDNPLDWRLTLERASKLVLLDSCFSNLVDQLNLPNEKYLVVRSAIQYTPVYKNGWRFICVDARPG